MTDRELARIRAREEGCKTVAPNEPAASTQPVRTPEERRPVAHCDPVIPATPTEFIKPSAVAVVTTTLPYGIPLPLIIVNTAVEVECADINGVGTIGDSVFIPAGKLQNFFILGDVPAITAAQLSYLATLDASQILAVITTQSDIALADFTNLTLDQCAFVKSAVFAIQEDLNTQVIAAAYGAIDCFYGNVAQSASCSGDAIQLSANIVPTDLGINNPSIVSAGTVLSKISVASANVEAAALAQALLVCVYGNDAMDVSCVDLGFVPPDFVLISDTEFNAPTAIHYDANTFVAATKIEANNIAKDAALSLLQCFYVNERVRVECGAEALETDPEVGSVNDNTTGIIVIAETGAVTSVVSAAAATAEAAIIATSLLRCSWGNESQTAQCYDVVIENDTPCPGPKLEEPVTYKPIDYNQITVEENEFKSTVSKNDANAQAAAFLASSINCVYCNPQVLPTCVPKYITDKLEDVIAKRFIPDTCPPNPPANGETVKAAIARWLTNPVLPLPLSIVTKDWSGDATVGVAANTYCDSNPETAVAAAKAAGQIPIRSLIIPAEDPKSPPECEYCNDQIIVKTPPGMEDIAGGSITISPCTVKVKNSDIPEDFVCDKTSFNTPTVIPCEKQYANYLATSQATAILRPAFKSKEFKTSCGQMAFQKKNNNVPPTAGQTAALTPLTYHPDSSGIPTNSIVIPAGAYESQIDQKDADDQALVDAMGQLDCFFKNNPITVLCDDNPLKNSKPRDPAKPTKGIIYGTGKLTRSKADGTKFGAPIAVDSTSAGSIELPVEVELDVVTSYISQQDANDNAAKIGIPMLDCFWTNRPIELRIGAPDKLPAETPAQELDPNEPGEFGTGVDVIDNIPGSKNQPVIVAPKTHKSYRSPREANEQAYTTMGSRMVSLYKSKKVTKECEIPVVGYTDPPDDTSHRPIETEHILANTAVSKVVLPEGQFTSSTSKKEADDLAETAATSMLLCIYTNAAIKNKTKCGGIGKSTAYYLDYQADPPNNSIYSGSTRYAVKAIAAGFPNAGTEVRENDFAIQAEDATYLTLGPVSLEENLFFNDGIHGGSYIPNIEADTLLSSLQTCHVLDNPYKLGSRAYGASKSSGVRSIRKLQPLYGPSTTGAPLIGYGETLVQEDAFGGASDNTGNGWVAGLRPAGVEAKDSWDRSRTPLYNAEDANPAYGFVGPVTRFETVNNSVTAAYTREIKADSKGAVWFVGEETKTSFGSVDVPYVMGSSLYGSITPGVYAAPSGLSTAQTDTWEIDKPPINLNGVITQGVTINQWVRFYISGSGSGTFTQKVFTRQEKKDSAGRTYYISAETLAETDTESGSGSAGGGL